MSAAAQSSAFAQGQPCWIDISVPDAATREGLMAFLGAVFGWTFDVGSADMGSYTMALHQGRPVCAIAEGTEGVGVWISYLNTADIDDTVARINANGGQAFLGPMEIPGQGVMGLAMDSVGAAFGFWQASGFAGFAATQEPGTPVWFMHDSNDPAAAATFYSAAFGLQVSDQDDSLLLGHGEISWMSLSPAEEGMQTQWQPVFAVESLAASEAVATSNGGTVLMSGMPVPGGHASALADPAIGSVIVIYAAD